MKRALSSSTTSAAESGTTAQQSATEQPTSTSVAPATGSQYADWDITNGVGYTALAVAAARGMESARPAPLITDRYAGAFVTAAEQGGARLPLPSNWPPDVADMAAATGIDATQLRQLWEGLTDYLAVRSRYFDRFLTSACHEAGIRQVVVLAAGLDTRAHRLDWPDGVRCFEIDHPNVLEFKNRVLAEQDSKPGCARHTVGADLRDDWPAALRDAGFDPNQPTAWLAEGLLFYLPDEAKQLLCNRVQQLSAPGSRWAIESLIDPGDAMTTLTGDPVLQQLSERMGIDPTTMWSGEQHWEPQPWLLCNGWTVTAQAAHTVAAQYGKVLDGPGPVGNTQQPTVLVSAEYTAPVAD